jgi:hypothetical protein
MTVWMEQGSAPDQPGARWIVPQRVDNQHPLTNEGSILAAFAGWVTPFPRDLQRGRMGRCHGRTYTDKISLVTGCTTHEVPPKLDRRVSRRIVGPA